MQNTMSKLSEFEKYVNPEIRIVDLTNPDIITTSYPIPDEDRDPDLGEWDTNI